MRAIKVKVLKSVKAMRRVSQPRAVRRIRHHPILAGTVEVAKLVSLRVVHRRVTWAKVHYICKHCHALFGVRRVCAVSQQGRERKLFGSGKHGVARCLQLGYVSCPSSVSCLNFVITARRVWRYLRAAGPVVELQAGNLRCDVAAVISTCRQDTSHRQNAAEVDNSEED